DSDTLCTRAGAAERIIHKNETITAMLQRERQRARLADTELRKEVRGCDRSLYVNPTAVECAGKFPSTRPFAPGHDFITNGSGYRDNAKKVAQQVKRIRRRKPDQRARVRRD